MRTKLESKKAQWLNKYRQSIELEPFFQRGTVWNKTKQQYFIDSLLKGWGTPKIFLWETGKDAYACLDGKQRLTSLFYFMADQLSLNSKYSSTYGGKKYSELPVSIQDQIDNYEFSVEVLIGAEKDEVVELYKRLQGGTPLNFGEKLFAISGNMNDFIKRRLATKKFFKERVALPDTRYSRYAVCAQLCLLSIRGAKEDLKLKNLEKFFVDYASFNDKSPESTKVLNVINFLEKVFPDKNDSALRNRANVVSVFYLISDLSGRGDISGREKEISSFFRKFVKNIQKELTKKPEDRDSSLLSYQSAVTQGADKIKSVNIRHDVLLKKIAEKNKFFYKLLYPPISPEDNFKQMYEKIRTKQRITSIAGFDQWLIGAHKLKSIKCPKARGKKETVVGHIRNCIHHRDHGTFTPKKLTMANKLLERILKQK
ncbi:MAG: hypothetical protein A2915_00985 [Candidatus Yanofskybacteria bacterium RIFCSPLOWO2_01_FULL_41_34]|nr:MAG: hypothetical protein A2915_00985 [Candidatus Yanofskybacteria bacterium RIFCSPLOWO2_01_FULL_41_34]